MGSQRWFEIDRRGLALFRILSGLYVLWDIYIRLAVGGLDWHTSPCHPTCAFDPTDTPHHALLHRILFYRGCWSTQLVIFSLHITTAVLYTLGVHTSVTAPLLWLATVSLQGRQEHGNDGSDALLRNMLAWASLLPLNCHFSPAATTAVPYSCRVQSWATAGMTLQLTMVYIGVMLRRIDRCVEWFDGRALYYALSNSFASRTYAHAFLSVVDSRVLALMSHSAGIIETIAPLAILCLPASFERSRMLAVVTLSSLHVGILVLLNIPQFQAISIMSCLTFLPESFFDRLFGYRCPTQQHSKNDGEIELKDTSIESDVTDTVRHRRTGIQNSKKILNGNVDSPNFIRDDTKVLPSFRTFLSAFMVVYSVTHFLSQSPWGFRMPDDGNIGEIFRFRQTWRMFCPLERVNRYTVVLGSINTDSRSSGVEGSEGIGESVVSDEEFAMFLDSPTLVHYDIFNSITSGHWDALQNATSLTHLTTAPLNVSDRFPSWRYERMFFFRPAGSTLVWFSRHLCRKWAEGMGLELSELIRRNSTVHFCSWEWRTPEVKPFSLLERHAVPSAAAIRAQPVSPLQRVSCAATMRLAIKD